MKKNIILMLSAVVCLSGPVFGMDLSDQDIHENGMNLPRRLETEASTNNIMSDLESRIKIKISCYGDHSSVHPLSYAEFMNLQQKGIINKTQAEKLIDYAYNEGNPILFRKADKEVGFRSYSLNFLWIHWEKQNFHSGCHLMGIDDVLFQNKVLNPLKDWQSQQPLAKINYWYDSEMVGENHQNVIENTKQKLSKSGIFVDNLLFLDIRIIKEVQENPNLFTEKVPGFWRVDCGKALTANYCLEKSANDDYVVNIDCDIAAVTHGQLFDQKTVKELDEIDYAFGATFGLQENSFIMLSKPAKDLHYKCVIKPSIEKANRCSVIREQDVFYCYNRLRANISARYRIKTGNIFDTKYTCLGKPMVFPQSQLNTCGYTRQQVEELKEALHNPSRFNK